MLKKTIIIDNGGRITPLVYFYKIQYFVSRVINGFSSVHYPGPILCLTRMFYTVRVKGTHTVVWAEPQDHLVDYLLRLTTGPTERDHTGSNSRNTGAHNLLST